MDDLRIYIGNFFKYVPEKFDTNGEYKNVNEMWNLFVSVIKEDLDKGYTESSLFASKENIINPKDILFLATREESQPRYSFVQQNQITQNKVKLQNFLKLIDPISLDQQEINNIDNQLKNSEKQIEDKIKSQNEIEKDNYKFAQEQKSKIGESWLNQSMHL